LSPKTIGATNNNFKPKLIRAAKHYRAVHVPRRSLAKALTRKSRRDASVEPN